MNLDRARLLLDFFRKLLYQNPVNLALYPGSFSSKKLYTKFSE
jgi:hypothetical protein